MNANCSIHQSAKGRMRWAVIDAATGEVVRESDWFSNLILNAGMDSVAVRSWVDNFIYCAVGTGVAPTADDSGTTTAAQSGTTVSLTGGSYVFDTVNDVGAVIKWDSGETAKIASFSNNTTATVTNSATVVSNFFTVFHTAQIALGTELKRTNNYLTGSPNCGTTIVGSQLRHRRTYDFTAEVGTVNYTEAGFGWSPTGPNNLFSRLLFPGPVTVLIGQQLRVVYELQVTVGPTSPNATTAIIGGWPVSPATDTTGSEQMVGQGVLGVNSSSGGQTSGVGVDSCEPYATSSAIFIASGPASFPAWPGNTGYANNVSEVAPVVVAPYVAGSYTKDKSGTFTVNQANRTDLLVMGVGYYNPPSHSYNNVGIAFIFNQAQTKLNTFTLTLTWRWTWSRDFS